MGWFSRKKQPKPLVPGRDRSSGGPQRPVYSYYAGRPAAPTSRTSSSGQSNARTSTNAPVKRRMPRLTAQTVVIVICSVLVLISLGNIVTVVPNSTVIVSADQDGHELSDTALESYAAAANELLKKSPLNRFKLTVDTSGIATSLRAEFPELESVVVTLPILGNRPVVYVASTTPVFALETPAGYYSLDKNGYVLAKLPTKDDSLIHLKDTSNRTPNPGDQYLASSITTFAYTMHYELTQAEITVNYLDLPVSAPYELVVHLTGEGYYIRTNLRADALQQSGAAIATLEYLSTGKPRQYLDVRTPERAYYR